MELWSILVPAGMGFAGSFVGAWVTPSLAERHRQRQERNEILGLAYRHARTESDFLRSIDDSLDNHRLVTGYQTDPLSKAQFGAVDYWMTTRGSGDLARAWTALREAKEGLDWDVTVNGEPGDSERTFTAAVAELLRLTSERPGRRR